MRLIRHLKGSLSLRLGSNLNLAAYRNSLAHSTKGTPSQRERLLRLLVGARFQVLFHSPLGVLFTFPSRYWYAIGHRRVFSLGGWSPLLRTGFHVPGPTREPQRPGRPCFAYGAVTRFGRPFHAGSAACAFVTGPAGREPAGVRSHAPHAATPRRLHAHGFGLVRFRSPLLAQSRLISLPPGT